MISPEVSTFRSIDNMNYFKILQLERRGPFLRRLHLWRCFLTNWMLGSFSKIFRWMNVQFAAGTRETHRFWWSCARSKFSFSPVYRMKIMLHRRRKNICRAEKTSALWGSFVRLVLLFRTGKETTLTAVSRMRCQERLHVGAGRTRGCNRSRGKKEETADEKRDANSHLRVRLEWHFT